MKSRLIFTAALMAFHQFCISQEKFDTLLIEHIFESEYESQSFEPKWKYIRTYDSTGRLVKEQGYQYNQGNPTPYFNYEETYLSNDGGQVFWISNKYLPRGSNKFQLADQTELTYNAQSKLVSKIHYGSTPDVWGRKDTSKINYYYDEHSRLVKTEERFHYKLQPHTIWIYNSSGDKIPEFYEGFKDSRTLNKVHYYLYKDGKLSLYREERSRHKAIEVITYEYIYNNDKTVNKVLVSEQEYSQGKSGAYRRDGKEKEIERHEYVYKNGNLMEIKREVYGSYIKYKPSFADRFASLGAVSVSTSTTRRGDEEITTTTTSYNQPTDVEMVKKTKYKWMAGPTTTFSYYSNGSLSYKSESATGQYWNYWKYDSMGRLTEYQSIDRSPDKRQFKTYPYRVGERRVYGYNWSF